MSLKQQYDEDLLQHPGKNFDVTTKEHPNYKLKIVRSKAGHYCGYVTLPTGHSCIGKNYDDVDCSVHGGLTYSDGTTFGFDCSHMHDYTPLMFEFHSKYKLSESYATKVWTFEMVLAEVLHMAEQFRELE